MPVTTAVDDSLDFFHCFSEKKKLDVSRESYAKIILDISFEFSARQRIHMKHQALFSSKEKKVSSAAIFLSGLKETFSFLMCKL